MSQTVFIVDDDRPVREAVEKILTGAGFSTKLFASAEEFLAGCAAEDRGCILLDVKMPGMSGPELQDELHNHDIWMPIIFLTAYGTVATSVRALHAGAFDFLEKPFPAKKLIEIVRNAFTLDEVQYKTRSRIKNILTNFSQLTLREREIMKLVASGRANKVIAKELGISSRTVEVHRRNIMKKMQTHTLLELASIAEILDFDKNPLSSPKNPES